MSTQTTELLSFVKWEALSSRETKRGKVKHVVTGIPGPMFWKRYKAATGEGKAAFKALNATLAKVAKGQWEVVMWINRHNAEIAAQLGFAVPSEEQSEATPAAVDAPF